MIEPWCVVLASREEPPQSGIAAQVRGAASQPDPLGATLRRAATVTSPDRIAAVIAERADPERQRCLTEFGIRNLFVQPRHQGTAYEVLLALLLLERHISPSTAVLFLPADHIVEDETVLTNSLLSLTEWIADAPRPVYLLGAIPQGPHDQLGYIVPWHGSMVMPTGVYEFVEKPDVRRARGLINDGGLWNTFIFGGTIDALLNLFVRDSKRSSRRSARRCNQTPSRAASPARMTASPLSISRRTYSPGRPTSSPCSGC